MMIYLGKRLGMIAAVLLILMVFLGGLIHLVPGDPVKIIMGPLASDSFAASVRSEMGLDKPIAIQMLDFIFGAVHGDLGKDFVSHRPVTVMIGGVLPHTMILAVTGLGLAILIGLPLGVYSAVHANSAIDKAIASVSITLITLPPYVAGLLLLLTFAVTLAWLPALGAGNFSAPLDYAARLILPSLALALGWIGYLARLTRASMLEILGANYVRTARSFGLSDTRIHYLYALRSAVIPVVAVLGVGLGHLLGGAIFIEVIFGRQGLGTLFYDAIATRNFPVIRGVAVVVATLFVVTNLLADLSYRLLDPRIRVEAKT
ncbi:ABC transporter permease [Phyllobacterium sp. SB3]|uniref:ABC transporter permease n=1 Tax=Phyllobacterium sp. SB3 TaxID=3156073 RepID=UPI0032AF0C1D